MFSNNVLCESRILKNTLKFFIEVEIWEVPFEECISI